MTVTTTYRDDVACVPRAGTLYDVIDIILDRGMVIDVFLRVSLVGIEILKIDVRVVIASVDTYLRFAEACNRVDLEADSRSRTVPELFSGSGLGGGVARAGAKRGLKKAAESTGRKAKEALTSGDSDDEDQDWDQNWAEEDEGDEEPRAESRERRGRGERSGKRSARRSREG
ncbi:gas vesicle protein GvpJ [Streptomyces sp. B6B3]|uniref:gas vesicle protein GvpJ n=1 Tax=Streptomyces sp. B6B3 TaxID=3153570 RepID=UPI00325EED38